MQTARWQPAVAPGTIQIAGVRSSDEAQMIAASGATHIGIPLRLSGHTADISEAEAAEIIAGLPGSLCPVLITYLNDAHEIAEFCAALAVPAVQLHGAVAVQELVRLRLVAPKLVIIKSLIIGQQSEDELTAQAAAQAPFVDAFITDTFDPESGLCGATGKCHDWTVSRRLVQHAGRPLILAGGLKPANVAAAIDLVRPAGVDSHTGVEAPDGKKDPQLVLRFIQEAKRAFRMGVNAGQ